VKLRDYQQEAVDAVIRYWEKGGTNPLVEVPTGGGKSAILGELARVVVEECGGRVVIATHRAELIEQDAAACRRVWPMAPLAVWSASLNKRGVAPITVCGVQTVARKARDLGVVDVLIVDEAHLIPPEGAGQYQTLVRGLRETNPGLRIVGLTATPYRLGQGYLTQGDGALFSSIVYRVDIGRLVAAGHLAPLVTGSVGAQIDTSQLAIRAGEFAARDLELAADISEVTERVADDVAAALASGRTSALLFGCSVAHAEHLRDALGARDVECAVITGETEQFTRQAIIGRFRRRELAALASCDVLTTGFDAPCVDVLAVVRATASPSLYVQIVGRGMRPAEGKRDCLVLDYGGNIARHGPVDEVKIRPKSKGDGKAPTKTCDNCAAEQPAGARTCSECDYEFPPPEKRANTEASALPVLSTGALGGGPKSTTHAIGETQYHVHRKRSGDGPPTVRVDYYGAEPEGASSAWVPTKVASEWICVEHEGFARSRAAKWWAQHVGTRMPATVAEAVERLRAGEMPRVVEIETRPDGDYTRVVRLRQEAGRQPGEDDEEEEPQAAEAEAMPIDPWNTDDLPF
jgi:DNA repair protein RadD